MQLLGICNREFNDVLTVSDFPKGMFNQGEPEVALAITSRDDKLSGFQIACIQLNKSGARELAEVLLDWAQKA